jgi:hypothetical protein
MRTFLRPISAVPLLAVVLAALLAGCSTGPSEPIQTSSLAPRDTPRKYVDPGHPTPREFAAASDQYDLEGNRRIQTASIEPRRTPYYASEPQRWRQPASGITTGSTGHSASTGYSPQPGYGSTPAYGNAGHGPNVVEVREGDTLYSLSRRYNVPVRDLVIANRLPSERIVIGQHLLIPTRYR